MASSDEAPLQGEVTLDGAGTGVATRRAQSKQVQEVMDELAQETKRVTLLEREEQQLKGQKHVSRLLFIFGIGDERKTQDAVDQEFATWRKQTEGASEVTGLLLFCGQATVSFMEGPTELLFKAVEMFQGLTVEVLPTPPMPTPPEGMKVGKAVDPKVVIAPPANPRPALISGVRVLYFTELHGVRAAPGWCGLVNQAKPLGVALVMAEDTSQQVFDLYKKLLVVCLKVKDSAGESEANLDVLQTHYRKLTDLMPTPDEVLSLLSKQSADNFFSFAEFQKIFMKPFQLVLNSELLWPMPPPLSY